MRKRRGFTLWEMATVLLIVAISATLAAPAFVRLGQDKTATSADMLMKLLHDTRAFAISRAIQTTLLLDPKTGHYRVDTTSSAGSGHVVEDTLHFGATEALDTDLPRLRYVFRPTGAAFADSVLVHGMDSTRMVFVDGWSGVAYAKVR
jgi:prepilin-type N-terminal cleavage/methylation domain-containing protein